MQNLRLSKKSITDFGGVELSLPVLEIGENPRLTIVATQHGGETAGLLVIDRLLSELEKTNLACQIIPIANPLALLFRTREDPLDKQDLNRSFPGNPEKNFTQKLSAAILDLVKNSGCVLDLHTFTNRQTGILGVYRKDSPMAEKNENFLRALAPDAVWEMDGENPEDRQFAGDLNSALGKLGVPAFGLELPRQQNITNDQIKRVVGSVLQLQATLNAENSEQKTGAAPIPVFRIKTLYSPTSGIFTPTAKVFDEIPAGAELGRIRSFSDFQTQSLKTSDTGTVLTLHYPDAIRTGEKLASIGTLVRTI